MAHVYLLIILAITLQHVASNPPQIQGLTYIGSASKSDDPSTMAFYYISEEQVTWLNAFGACMTVGGQLVSPNKPVDDDALRSYMIRFNAGAVIWTGARKCSGIWKWEPKNINVIWSNWHSTTCASNTGCVSAYTIGNNWAWCGENCNNSRYYVCEFSY